MAGPNDITPRQTGSWAVSIGRSQVAINRLDQAIRALESSNTVMRDPERAERCRVIIELLLEMIEKFEKWPNKPRIEVEKERPLIQLLRRFELETDEICKRLGPSF